MMYPPIVATAQPTFDYKSNVRVYFALSPYDSSNGTNAPSQAQVVVKYQSNNKNALKVASGILLTSIGSVSAADDPVIGSRPMHYYVTIHGSDLQTNGFTPNTIYKVQIRFKGDTGTAPISEWSTVCLLKPIITPTISLVGFPDSIDNNEISITNFYSVDPIFTGIYTPGTNSNETLKTWQMILYNGNGDIILADSGIVDASIYATNTTTPIECQLPYTMSDSTKYQIYFAIQTKNGYTKSMIRQLMAYSYASAAPTGQVNLIINEEDGYAKVSSKVQLGTAGGSLTLRRTSSQSQFIIWQDIANQVFTEPSVSWDYYDFTIKSGVFYQYAVQKRDSYGRRSQSLRTDRQMGEFDDAFLVEKSESLESVIQLKLRYDTSISNQLINISQSKTDTIGGKYPFVRRNGNMYYHSFPLSGLITTYMDNSHIFATDNELYDQQKDLYQTAFGNHNLSVMSGQYNYTLEREFREKVKAFLYDDKIKLFRSLTQGNMLIKLMDISLTPKEQLGRLIYSFSATAVEVDEPTIKNFDKYNILTIGNYTPDIVWTDSVLGQLHYTRLDENGRIVDAPFPRNANLMGEDTDKPDIPYPTIKHQQHYKQSYAGASIQDLALSYLRIQIEDQPYLIKNTNGILQPLESSDSTEDRELLLGTLIDIGGTTIIIQHPNTIYEMKGDNVLITNGTNITPLCPADREGVKMLITYIAELSEQADISLTASTIVQSNVIGQLTGLFDRSKEIWASIWAKYYMDLYDSDSISIGNEKFYIKLNSIYEIQVEADEGSIFYISSTTSPDEKVKRMQIDESGALRIAPDKNSATILNGYFTGKCIDGRWLNGGSTSQSDLPSINPGPGQYNAYKDSDGVHIYYNGDWYAATPAPSMPNNRFAYDIECPVDAIVNYYASIERGTYS